MSLSPTSAFSQAARPSSSSDANEVPLRPSENVRAALDVDLDARLNFVQGRLILTNQRLVGWFPDATAWQGWDLAPGMAMAHLDHAGVGTLELRSDQRLLATWRFTLGHNPAALRLLAEFDRALAEPMADSAASGPAAEDEHDLPDVDEEEGADEKPPSTWTLLRLWRFAHPTAGAAGRLLLTLAGTAATWCRPT
jgi:ATP-binding cassette subfamily B protein